MHKVFKITDETGIGTSKIKAYQDGDCVLNVIVDDYNVEGASLILKALGYNEVCEDY